MIWLEFQDCAGDTESFLRACNPSVSEILLGVLSVDYHETFMAAAGHDADAAREATIAKGGGADRLERQPRDAAGRRGAYEAALIDTPVADPTKPLEILRTVHSFDPCMACAAHIIDADGQPVVEVRVQ